MQKIEIVPRGKPGDKNYEKVRKVKVRGKLRNGREIEYYPGEVILIFPGMPASETYLENYVKEVEKHYGLALINKVRIGFGIALKFRILNNRDVLTILYSILDDPIDVISEVPPAITPNGMGKLTIEMPEDDFHVEEGFNSKDLGEIKRRNITRKTYKKEKYPFLLEGEIYIGKMNYPFREGEISIYVESIDTDNIGYDDVLKVINDENGILIQFHRSMEGNEKLTLPGSQKS